jgi:hypothetical protein
MAAQLSTAQEQELASLSKSVRDAFTRRMLENGSSAPGQSEIDGLTQYVATMVGHGCARMHVWRGLLDLVATAAEADIGSEDTAELISEIAGLPTYDED